MVLSAFLIAFMCLAGLIVMTARHPRPKPVPVAARPAPRPDLPAFLTRAQDAPPRIHQPAFTTPARAARAAQVPPVEIADFDVAEDVIALLCTADDPAPQIQLNKDSRSGDAMVIADGRPVAVIRAAGPEFSLAHVAIRRQAA